MVLDYLVWIARPAEPGLVAMLTYLEIVWPRLPEWAVSRPGIVDLAVGPEITDLNYLANSPWRTWTGQPSPEIIEVGTHAIFFECATDIVPVNHYCCAEPVVTLTPNHKASPPILEYVKVREHIVKEFFSQCKRSAFLGLDLP